MTDKKLRILVCGSRDFVDTQLLEMTLNSYLPNIACIIEGEARGADSLAKKWATFHNIPIEAYPAQWSKHGKRAGMLRNYDMINKGKPDLVLAFTFTSGITPGTANMVKLAKRYNVPTTIFHSTQKRIHE